MKSRKVTIILLIAFFIGLSVMLYPSISSYWNSKTQSEAIVDYESMLAQYKPEDFTQMFEEAETYNRELYALNDPMREYGKLPEYNQRLNLSGNGMMGYISIPKINQELPVYHGTSDSVLSTAVGHIQGSSLPVGGESTHCVLSAHRGLPTAVLFTHLDRMEIGDTFQLTILDRTLTYEVDQIRIVEPDDTSLLQIEEGKDYCTLLTCTPYGINTQRLLVRGHQVDETQTKNIYVANEAFRIGPVVVMPFVALPIIIVLLLYVMFAPVKKRNVGGGAGMKKGIMVLLALLMLGFALPRPMSVSAETLDPDAQASLTLHYEKEQVPFAQASVEIYRVAKAYPDGTFQLVEPYAFYPIRIHDISRQEQWQNVAQTLEAYIVANQVAPDRTAVTDETGTVCFEDLQTGLYYVRQVVAENDTGVYIFHRFMVYVPTPGTDGSYQYQVDAKPKCTEFVPKTQYTVTKLWQDGGRQDKRPQEVTVDIYDDGVLYESQVLNQENNWSYTWKVTGDKGKWTVVEKAVPEGYQVTIQQNGSSFSVINTRQVTPDTPYTGDTFTPLPWIIVMCVSGMILLILGIYGRRRR